MKRYVVMFTVNYLLAVAALSDPGKWWIGLDFQIPPTNDLEYASAQLALHNRHVMQLNRVDFAAEDAEEATNVWFGLARLLGDTRNKSALPPPIVYRSFGIVTNSDAITALMTSNADRAKFRKYQGVAEMLDLRIKDVFKKAVSSPAMSTFSAEERNTIVSNLVVVAGITVDEAESLGMTNVFWNAIR